MGLFSMKSGSIRAVAGRSPAADPRAVADYLSGAGLEDKAMVDTEGNIVAVQGIPRRWLTGLTEVVETSRGKTPGIRFVSPLGFQKIRDNAAAHLKSGSQQAEIKLAGNVTVDYVLEGAVLANASDIYLDLRRDGAVLSHRVWGQVTQVETMTLEMGRSVARGLFSKADNAQWQEKAPCDCSFSYRTEQGRHYRVRCNSLPDIRGQSLSCRVRDPAFVLPLSEAGYSAHQRDLIRRICRAPGGLIIVSGETNSGKSTSLAGLMLDAPRRERMIEIADPVEVEMEHCTHVEIDHYRENAREYFSSVLAATVRQNPDSLVLGEIRDEDTAQAAQSMAIQGKRVYSSLHTQSCVAAIPRLMNLGVDPHLLSLREFCAGIINQNLVPVVCRNCGLDRHPDPEQQARYAGLFGEDIRFINPEGCDDCVAGVTGQTLVAEVYPLYLDNKRAHQMIARQELWQLASYMQEEFQIQSKQAHARDKVLAGTIDPAMTEAIIGEWTPPGTPEEVARG